MIIVKKFGGKALKTKEEIYNVANICKEDYLKGNDVILVLSARGDETDELINEAKYISDEFEQREMDMLISTGEQKSVAYMTFALNKINIPAVSLNAYQVPIYTDSNYGDAKISDIGTKRIKKELAKRKVVVITGFQGIDKENNLTTLGRGGSDTTAVAIAAKMKADKCEIYKDVDGVYSNDPKKDLKAIKYDKLQFDEMLRLSNSGAKILQNKSVEIARKNAVPIFIKSIFTNKIGTVID
jgi:aspartate kinase